MIGVVSDYLHKLTHHPDLFQYKPELNIHLVKYIQNVD